MEEPMKKSKLPNADSIRELAEFCDAHDVTEFEDELEEVTEPVFVRGNAIKVPLESVEAEAVEKIAKANGMTSGQLVRKWVLQNLPQKATP
jgi:hypothetical protein